jgi:hypothetical protein
LSWVKILPKAADHTKNATLVGALAHHIFFHGNDGPSFLLSAYF